MVAANPLLGSERDFKAVDCADVYADGDILLLMFE